jgi:uncharacterized protein (DUF2147 family)
MKEIIILLSVMICTTISVAQKTENSIVGIWKTELAKILIYKTTSGHYAGKVIAIDEPLDPKTKLPKTDLNNPNKNVNQKPIIGLVVLYGFTFNTTSQIWEGGKIYDPNNGKTYSCKMTLTDNNNIKVRGFIGISLIGRTEIWTRVVE